VAVNSLAMLGADPDGERHRRAVARAIDRRERPDLGMMVHELRRNGGGPGLAVICRARPGRRPLVEV
jgi:hypothetical protein